MTAEATKLDARRAIGYRLGLAEPGTDAAGHEPLAADVLLGGPLPVARFAGSRLAPALALVLGGDVGAGGSPEAVHLAVPGAFLALELQGGAGGLVVSERLLPLSLDGSLRLYLAGSLVQEASLAALGSPAERLARLAARVGGLRAGELVLLAAAGLQEVGPGAVEVWGPLGSTLTMTLSEDES